MFCWNMDLVFIILGLFRQHLEDTKRFTNVDRFILVSYSNLKITIEPNPLTHFHELIILSKQS